MTTQNDQQRIRQLEEELSNSYTMNFGWAGNLGRWEWIYETGEVLYNAKKIEALGFNAQEVTFKVYDWTARIHPDDHAATMQAMKDHLEGISDVYECEYRIRTKDDSYKWFYDRGKIVEYNEQHRAKRVVGIVFDITERKKIEEQLSADIDFKNKVLAVISHDLRGPIEATSMLLTGIMNKPSSNTPEVLSAVIQAQKELAHNLEMIVEWAKTNFQRHSEDIAVDLYECLSEQIRLISIMAAMKQITIINNIRRGCKAVGTIEIISVIFRNILMNAVKFSANSSTVEVRQDDNDAAITIIIRDSGIGMPQKILEKIKRKELVKGHQGTNGEKGTGLGLLICRDLLSRIGGSMDVESSEGHGTAVKLTFTARESLIDKKAETL